jgi:V-type H+-transporting ATPase subunit E
MQEAHEKVNEINIKAEHDFNVEKQTLHIEGNKKVDEEYVKKEKDLEKEQRVQQSNAVSNARVKRMESRDALLDGLKGSVTEKLKAFVKSPQYPTLLRQLIVQGLLKMQEPVVEILARTEDKQIVTRVIAEALTEYRNNMPEGGVSPKVTVSEYALSQNVTGGVILAAQQGRILCNQTLDERLAIAYIDKLPNIREKLFGK